MTNEQYVAGAVATESPVTDAALLDRVTSPQAIHTFLMVLRKCIQDADALDLFKKYFFYGKDGLNFQNDAATVSPQVKERLTNPTTLRLLHAAIGLMTESAEMLQMLSDHIFDGFDRDHINAIEEGGDAFWYLAIWHSALNISFEQSQEINNRKLRARYPDKFNSIDAINRDLKNERSVLTEGVQSRPFSLPKSFLCKMAWGGIAHIDQVDPENGFIYGRHGDESAIWDLAGIHCSIPSEPRCNLIMETIKEI